jgi:hypothetical protein
MGLTNRELSREVGRISNLPLLGLHEAFPRVEALWRDRRSSRLATPAEVWSLLSRRNRLQVTAGYRKFFNTSFQDLQLVLSGNSSANAFNHLGGPLPATLQGRYQR